MGKFLVLAAVSFASVTLMAASQVQAITYQTPPVSMTYHNGASSQATSVKTDSQGNIYEAVTSMGENGTIVKFTPDGQTAWTVDFDPSNPRPADKMGNFVTSTGIAAVAVDRNDNIYAVGESHNGIALDCLLKKYNADGTLIWQTRYSVPQSGTIIEDQYCHDITVDNAGDIIAGGTSLIFNGTNYSGYGNQILKWDASGKLIGKFNLKTNGTAACGPATPCQSQIMKVVTDLNQNIYAIGKMGGVYANTTYYRKFSKDLMPLANRYAYINNNLKTTAIAVDTQGHVFGSGYETVYSPTSGHNAVYRTMNVFDSNLNMLCDDKTYVGLLTQYTDPTPYGFNAIVIGPDEKAYLAGSQDKSFAVMAYNAQCQPQWLDAAGNPALLKAQVDSSDFSNAVTIDNNNNLIIAGRKSDQVATDAVTVKFAPVVTPTSSDLVISALFAPSALKTGQTFNAGGYLRNQGDGPTGDAVSGAHWLGLYLSTDNIINRQDILLCRTPVIAQAGSQTLTYHCEGTPPANLLTGTYHVGVITDDGNLISETDETNNTHSEQLQYTALPDLVVVSGAAPASAENGQQITVTATIKNQGAGAAISTTAGIYISSDSDFAMSDSPVCSAAVGTLAPGASQEVSCTGTIPMNTYGGKVYIGVLADNTNADEETNETNNSWSQAFSLTALPDLVISMAVSPATAQRGEQITVSGTVSNQGYGATGTQYSGYYFVSMYLSQDNVITSTDTALCSVGFGTTPANTTIPFSCTATIPASIAAGNYYVGFVADSYGNGVVESDETNNNKVNAIAITQ
ncbi:CARDB domain repeat protein [Geotalea daltonii FRC-32]|uniref:CARDB domain repeat protein n=1 Tax=Geotalea daltonii (strain DSM 22248 / JCM 15807 / FRC-32) TaxID=316067 RepID=B9M2F4_GEODF|nr:CARDB domain-containing protein [Geotalea daltonii]ACM19333.1 CARDB domain repeat protein [Geotalea daltonii FRC-32]